MHPLSCALISIAYMQKCFMPIGIYVKVNYTQTPYGRLKKTRDLVKNFKI